MTDRFCVNCKHCVTQRLLHNHGHDNVYLCASPNIPRDNVTGQGEMRVCKENRSDFFVKPYFKCGPDGSWFEPVEKHDG